MHSIQTDEELAELVARFRTPPGFDWMPLRDDILTLIRGRRKVNPNGSTPTSSELH